MINNKFLVFIILRLCICKNSDYRVNFYELIFSLAPKLTMKLSPLIVGIELLTNLKDSSFHHQLTFPFIEEQTTMK